MRILALAHIDGRTEGLEQVKSLAAEERCDAVVVAGSLLPPAPAGNETDRAQQLHRVLVGLADAPCPVCVIPGENDAPERLVMPAATAEQWVARNLRSVHGSFALVGNTAVVGFGGAITDTGRDVDTRLSYPAWEAAYRLAFIRELDQRLVLVFHQPHAEAKEVDVVDGEHRGSRGVTALIGTWRPRLAVVGGVEQGREVYGDTVVVSPGAFSRGHYAVADENARNAVLT